MNDTTDFDRPGTPADIGTGAPDSPEDRSGEDLGRLGEEGGSIGQRVGRDPSNLGDEIPDVGDVTHPDPVGETPQM